MANCTRSAITGLAILLTSVQTIPAYAASPWRFWTKADGLRESVVFGLTSKSNGHILVKLGAVPSIAELDGYQITEIPSPHVQGRFLESRDQGAGGLWTFDAAGIDVHDALGWHKYPDNSIAAFAKTPPMLRTSWFMYSVYRGPEDRIDVVPAGEDSGLLMFPDRLVEWNRITGRKRVILTAGQTALVRFRDIQLSRNGFWVTGEKGLGHLTSAREGFRWTGFPAPDRRTDLVNPIEGQGGEIFTSALRRDGKRTLLRFDGGKWEEVFVGSAGQLKGWRGPDNEIWVQNGRKIIELGANHSEDLGGGRIITGLTTAVVSESGKAFWLGTTEGVARYSPSLWRTPGMPAGADSVVNAIVEDRRGRIWFLSGQLLVVDDHETWRSFQLPSGRRESAFIDQMVALPNGDLAIRGNSLAEMIVFSPVSGTFRVVKHPDGKRVGGIGERRGGTVWVQVFDNDGLKWRLDGFDGVRFSAGGNPEFTALRDLKAVLETRNGDIWLGSTDSLGRIRGGKLQLFGTKDGFADTGVFSAVETASGSILVGGRENITEYDGRAFRVMRSIDEADSVSLGSNGSIWAGSGSGVHRYNKGQWITNTVDDGLPATTVRKVYSDSRGRIWAGTSRGISLFYPDADTDPPATNIVDDQNLRETPPGGEVRLVFSGTDKWKFTSADRLLFSWRLDESPWSDFGPSHLASFKGLHSGAHHFEVRAMDRNGNIDRTPATYQFSVLLPWFWQTEFLILAGLAVFVIALLSRMAWRHHRRVEFQSRHDPLTSLANRNVFEANFQMAITDARWGKTGVAMILLDLDRFKPVNDTLGHVVGDRFLQEVSKRLRSAIRKQDTLARLGGDEFAILMPGLVSRSEAESMAQKILGLLRLPYQIDSFELKGSASIGVSLFPDHGEDAATLHRLADMAMYQCKAQNKDGYAVFDPHANRLDFRTAEMAGLIREALDKGHFRLLYQPLKSVDGELTGFEALIRLEHPQFGTVQPNDFISIAEDTGLIVRIGNWVMAEACRQMAIWHAAGHRRLRVNVNVSPVQLAKPDFAENLKSILLASMLDPCALTLEITETTMIGSWKESLSQIAQLRALGITIALDDFGTGYSSLSSLHLLPVDYIKIDRSFIERIDDETSDGLIVIEAIAPRVHRFGVEVVAEGVE
jgi:diguanylate cyclase (GGDEF)-like protein